MCITDEIFVLSLRGSCFTPHAHWCEHRLINHWLPLGCMYATSQYILCILLIQIRQCDLASLKYNQQYAMFSRSIYFYKLLYMFQVFPPPILCSISSTIAAVLVWQCLMLYVQFCAPEDRWRNCLKHVEQFIEINRSRKRILLVVL